MAGGRCCCRDPQPCADMRCWAAWPLLGRFYTPDNKATPKPDENQGARFTAGPWGALLAEGASWEPAWDLAGPGTQGLGLAPLGMMGPGAVQGKGREGQQALHLGHPGGIGEKARIRL